MSKRFRKVRGIEELPSFLLHLSAIPEDVSFPPRPTITNLYLGPVFFGKSNENHPPLHSVNFSTFRHTDKPFHAKDNIYHLFLPKTVAEKPVKESKPLKLKRVLGRKHVYSDPYLHRCPGTRRTFVPDVKPPVIDLGESSSVIEGETVLEIPLYRLKKVCSGSSAPEFELVNFSDLQENKRIFMPYKERISHVHFPKEFATVTVVGPTIPASITITKLPSKRKTQSAEDLLNAAKVRRSSKEVAEEKIDEVTEEPEEVDFFVEEGDSAIFSVRGSIHTEKNLETQITEEEEEEQEEDEDGDDLQEFSTEQIGEDIKETTKEINNEEKSESREHPVEEINAGEMEGVQVTGENEEQLEENPEEEPGD